MGQRLLDPPVPPMRALQYPVPQNGLAAARPGPMLSLFLPSSIAIGIEPTVTTTYVVTQTVSARPTRDTHVATASPKLVSAAPYARISPTISGGPIQCSVWPARIAETQNGRMVKS